MPGRIRSPAIIQDRAEFRFEAGYDSAIFGLEIWAGHLASRYVALSSTGDLAGLVSENPVYRPGLEVSQENAIRRHTEIPPRWNGTRNECLLRKDTRTC